MEVKGQLLRVSSLLPARGSWVRTLLVWVGSRCLSPQNHVSILLPHLKKYSPAKSDHQKASCHCVGTGLFLTGNFGSSGKTLPLTLVQVTAKIVKRDRSCLDGIYVLWFLQYRG